MKRMVAAALGGLALALVGGCSGSGGDDCSDFAREVCEKMRDCGVLGVSMDRCVETNLALANRSGMTDEQCLQERGFLESMSCAEYLAEP